MEALIEVEIVKEENEREEKDQKQVGTNKNIKYHVL